MPTEPLSGVLGFLHNLAAPAEAGRSDAELLRRFVQQREEAAFTALVQRHGPLVLGVCARVLNKQEDVEDAFQATFLVLARKVDSLVRPERLANFLYGVALRTARKARARAARLPVGSDQLDVPARPERDLRELCAALDEELARLPEKYRAPLVLCCLGGASRAEAARQLGQGEGVIKGLLERGRQRLRERLERRGLRAEELPAVLVPVVVPAELTRAAARIGVGDGLPGQIVALAEGVMRCMALNKLATGSALFLLLLLAGTGAGLTLRDPPAPPANGPVALVARPTARAPGAALRRAPIPVARPRMRELKHKSAVLAVAYSSGKFLATGLADGNVIVWEADTGKEAHAIKSGKEAVRAVAFSPDGKFLAFGGDDQTITLWDVARGARVWRIQSEIGVRSMAFTPDGTGLLCGGAHNRAQFFDARTGKRREEIKVAHDMKELVESVAFSRDGALELFGGMVALNIGTHWTTFYVRDRKTKKIVASLDGPKFGIEALPQNIAFPPPVAFAPNSKDWAGAYCDHSITYSGRGRAVGHRATVTSLVFARDGKRLISGSLDDTIRFWDVATLKEVARVPQQGKVIALALSGDGKSLASVTGSTVLVRDLASLFQAHRLDKKKGGKKP
jgi:RNA polymerase sigma factor (sigma-70 family)